jgi:hypothetical protein
MMGESVGFKVPTEELMKSLVEGHQHFGGT